MNEYLEWAKHYFKSKDAFKKEIQDIEVTDSYLILKKEGSKELVQVVESMEELSKEFLTKFDSVWLICKDSSKLTQSICDSWDFLTAFSNLKLLSIDLKSASKWIINPYSHSKIVEPNSLKKSLDILRQNA